MSKKSATLDLAGRSRVEAVFNAAGAPADLGRTIRAGIVIALSVTLVIAIMAGLTGRARAGHDDAALIERTPFSQAFTRHLSASANTSCLPASIKAALATANAACGIRVISTFRPGAHIAGTNHVSMHASCRAADFTTRDYHCAYRALAAWSGKLSVDAWRVHHIHIDDGRYARFEHGRSRRYAKRHQHRRYARRHGRRA
jgi:hypothetical protein